jgi:hypothetical protein
MLLIEIRRSNLQGLQLRLGAVGGQLQTISSSLHSFLRICDQGRVNQQFMPQINHLKNPPSLTIKNPKIQNSGRLLIS